MSKIAQNALTANEVGKVAMNIAPFQKETPCIEVCDYFAENPEILAVAVADGEKPIGLIYRDEFLLLMSNPSGHALFDDKPVTQAMDATPLIVESTIKVGVVARLMLHEKPSALRTGFIITNGGKYFGVGLPLEMLRYGDMLGQERERARDAAQRDAVLANEAKTMFLANMSHELRTPLNAIIGFSEVMCSELFGSIGNERYKEYARDIHQSGSHLLGLVNDLLDTAQFESGQLKLHAGECDLQQVIEHCFTQLSLQADAAGVLLINRAPKTLPKLYADEGKLRQIFLNLLSNAVKFTPAGGRVTIQSSILPNGDFGAAVVDTGIGIDPEDIHRVLQKFGQVENCYQRKFSGAGLGLPLAKSLVELHGGVLKIKSIVDKGTTVCFTLPRERVQGQREKAVS